MKLGVGQFFRVLGIQRVLIRHGLDDLLLDLPWFRPLRFLFFLLPWNWGRARPTAPRAERILHVLEELGPLFVKFGQLLSTRRDLLPEDMALALARLQDRVPPFPSARARQLIEQAFQRPVEEIFASFEDEPLASASIAQVHAARLHDGSDVVVKVVRPDIEVTIRRDLALLQTFAELIERYSLEGRRLKPTGVVAEYRRVVLDELDLQREAASASQLRRNFGVEPAVYVPQVHWDLTTARVMVMERIRGIPINDLPALEAAGVDLRELAETGVELFFTQVFRDRFFHADMHPGNLFVQPADGEHGLRIAPVDFGIMGTLSDFDQRYLADNFLAFLERDYRRVAELHIESGWVPAETRVDEFEFAIRAVCEPMLERPMKDISIGHLLLRLFQTAQRFHMHILPQLVLLQKTLVNIEGVGRQLYPDLDIWRLARPALRRWMGERVGLRRLWVEARRNLPYWIERMPEMPGLLHQFLEHGGVQRAEAEARREAALVRLAAEIQQGERRRARAIGGAALVLSATLVALFAPAGVAELGPLPLASWVLALPGAYWLLRSASA